MKNVASPIVLLAGVLAIGVAGVISATPSAQDTVPTSMPDGAQISADSCADCHGADGLGTAPEYPHLAGQYAHYISSALEGYKSGAREGEIMQEIAAGLTSDEITAVTAYYAELPPFSRTVEPNADALPLDLNEDPLADVRQATAGCAGCHGPDGNDQAPGIPALASQSMPYMIDALKGYRDNARGEGVMKMFAAGLDDKTIEEMAFFYAVQSPEPTKTENGGDSFGGRATVAGCVSCHGADGNSNNPSTPRLAGLDSQYLASAIRAYRDGTRPHTAMQDAVANVRDAEIDDVGAFYATKAPKASAITKPLTTAEWVDRCARCHGINGSSADERFPLLAGQSETYLVSALKHYHLNERSNSMMYAMSFKMRASDIERIAAYYARQSAD